jgi:hypothetical protein
LDGDREMQAASCCTSVYPHRTGAANAMLAADMRGFQPDIVPDEIDEKAARLHVASVAFAIDCQSNVCLPGGTCL